MSPTPAQISGYLVLPIKLPATGIAPEAIHYLYLRRHEPKIPGPDDSRSLFLINVPIDATLFHFRALFTSIGGGLVERVAFEGAAVPTKKRKRGGREPGDADGEAKVWDREIRRSGSTAVAVFVDNASREAALKAVAKKAIKGKRDNMGEVAWGEGVAKSSKMPALGVSRKAAFGRSLFLCQGSSSLVGAIGYLTHHNLRYPAKALLQASVDTYMTTFAEEETARLRAMARRRQEPDEDGFITVVRGGRVAPARQEEAKATLEKKKEKGSHEGFYRFQAREDRKKRQLQLLAKFEEDKKKVAARKSQRKFKPL